jgi:hypothetical protein
MSKKASSATAWLLALYSKREATMTAVVRLGFHVRLKTAEGMRGARIAFLHEVRDALETRRVLVEMVQPAAHQPN